MKTKLAIIVVLIAVAAGLYVYLRAPSGTIISSDEQLQALNAPAPSSGFNLPQAKLLPNGNADLSGPIEYKVSFGSADGPTISRIVFAPYDVKPGQAQNIYVVGEYAGGVSGVTASIKTDKGIVPLQLTLAQGDAKNGVWQGTWTAKDVHPGYYVVDFAVASADGKSRGTIASFLDGWLSDVFAVPVYADNGAEQCGIPVTGDAIILTGGCVIAPGTADAVVNGDLTINGPLSLGMGATFGFSNGNKIFIPPAGGGSIVIPQNPPKGRIVKMGVGATPYNVYVEDRDGDKYWDNQAVVTSNPYGTGGYLRASSTQLGLLGGDCNDTNLNVHPGQTAYFTVTTTTDLGANTFDYNCDASQTPEYANSETCFGISPQATCQNTHLNGTDWDSHAGSIPACGAAGSWINTAETCLWATSPGCYDTTSSYAQPCR